MVNVDEWPGPRPVGTQSDGEFAHCQNGKAIKFIFSVFQAAAVPPKAAAPADLVSGEGDAG
jgi:hypothetical protein